MSLSPAPVNSASVIEQEISYTFAYSQDVLYRLKDWLDCNMILNDEYVEIIDTNDVRTRISEGQIKCSVKKRVIDLSRIVVPVESTLVPIIKRECHEIVYTDCNAKIKRIGKTRVYTNQEGMEIKFEQIYYEYNLGDSLDPLMASKQIALYNILKPTENNVDITINSHLGSDEILANCRLELEYDGCVSQKVLHKTANIINYIESVVLQDVIICPFISHTIVLNEICYRPFVNEILFGDNVAIDNVKLWALKINGIRGKGYIINGDKIYIQLDTMQMFCGKLKDNFNNLKPNLFHNKIVGVQMEYVNRSETFYITDILNVYKYKYDNRNQYDVGSAVTVDIFDAVSFLNSCVKKSLSFIDDNSIKHKILFQHFNNHKDRVDVSREQNDGYVGITECGGLIKYKSHKSYEMKYVGSNTFVCSFGEYVSENGDDNRWTYNKIYEVVIIKDKIINVIKARPDRLVSN
nr:LEF-4 [Darna trima granulovirus]